MLLEFTARSCSSSCNNAVTFDDSTQFFSTSIWKRLSVGAVIMRDTYKQDKNQMQDFSNLLRGTLDIIDGHMESTQHLHKLPDILGTLLVLPSATLPQPLEYKHEWEHLQHGFPQSSDHP
nr:hypothetical protein Iba_scaffold30859CG0010 [Ipomoea batatas]